MKDSEEVVVHPLAILATSGQPPHTHILKWAMELGWTPDQGEDVAGGLTAITVDDDDEETLQELAGRVREVEAMRMEDMACQADAVESPTEIFGEEQPGGQGEEVSPLLKLKQAVDAAAASSSTAGPPDVHMEIDKDEYGIIESERQKLKRFVPESLRMPWERGFAGVVLGGADKHLQVSSLMESTRSAKFMEIEVEKKKVESSEVKIKPSFVIKDKERLPWDRAQSEERDRLLTGWKVVIAEAGDHSKVEAMMRQHGEQVLDDVFAKKKNGTSQVRLSAMMLYVRWSRAKGLDPFPLLEDQCYAYVDQLRRDGAPATRASSFRRALAFCKGTIQLGGVDEILQSGRITGSAHRSFLTKRTLRQRDALTVHQVSVLERVLCGETFPLQDRIFAGHCLVCIYGRLGFGDSQGIQQDPVVDGGYLEGGTSTHKTDSIAGRGVGSFQWLRRRLESLGWHGQPCY